MNKLHASVMEEDAFVSLRSLSTTVANVAEDRASDCGELSANLMVAAGNEVNLQKATARDSLNEAVVEHSLMAIAVVFADYLCAMAGVTKRMFQAAFSRFRLASNNGKVCFFNCPSPHKIVHSLKGFACSCEQDDAAGLAIKAVDGMEENFAGFAEILLYPCFGQIFEVVASAFRIRLRQKSGRLISSKEMIVLIKNIQGHAWPFKKSFRPQKA